MSTSKQLCTFLLNEMLFGIEVLEIQEVISHQAMTPVPLAPNVVQGLINLRGQIVTAVDLRRRLSLPPRNADLLPINLVVHTNDGAVSLLVDDIGDVVEVGSDTFEPPPETIGDSARELIDGVYKLKGRLILNLNKDKAVNFRVDPRDDRRSAHSVA